jgi:hypothetical protein
LKFEKLLGVTVAILAWTEAEEMQNVGKLKLRNPLSSSL